MGQVFLTLIRNALLFSFAVRALPVGGVVSSFGGGLVASPGCATRSLASGLPAHLRAVLLPAVAVRAEEEHLPACALATDDQA